MQAATGAGTGARLAELLSAFAIAGDLGRGQPIGHLFRTCFIAMRVAQEMKLPVQGAQRARSISPPCLQATTSKPSTTHASATLTALPRCSAGSSDTSRLRRPWLSAQGA